MSQANSDSNDKLTVFFDGLCVVCSKEINHYRKQRGADRILFIDITSAEFDAQSEGVDPFEVNRVMHAKKSSGEILTKVDAFIAIWEKLPKYQWVARLAKRAPINWALQLGYLGFAKIRPWLPRRARSDCESSPFCEIHEKKN